LNYNISLQKMKMKFKLLITKLSS